MAGNLDATYPTKTEFKDVAVDPSAARETGYPGGNDDSATTSTYASKSTKTSYKSSGKAGYDGGPKKKGGNDEEKRSLLIKSAAAAAALIAIGLAIYKAKDNKNRHGDEYEVDFDRTKHKAHDNAEKAKHKAEDAADKTKHQASNTTDDFKHQAEKAKHEVAKIVPQPVKDTSDKIGDKAHHVKESAPAQEKAGQTSLDLERKGLRASEKSDHNVHKAYDKTADALHGVKGDAKDKAHEAKGNVKEASHKAEKEAKSEKKGGSGCVVM